MGTSASTSVRQAVRSVAPERGLVGTVAADVADEREDRAVGALDDVVEVAAEQRRRGPAR